MEILAFSTMYNVLGIPINVDKHNEENKIDTGSLIQCVFTILVEHCTGYRLK